MIKRIRFATRSSGLSQAAFAAAWRKAVAMEAEAPLEARPGRIAICVSLPEVIAEPVHDGISLEWFADDQHLSRFEEWLETAGGRPAATELGQCLDLARSPLLHAEELVLRGGDWLERRWAEGSEKLKHMAIARRAAGLSLAEFSERWKGRAGKVQRAGDTQALVIPDEAKGRAYVQNHPRPRPGGDWAYDALNEVYFDDLDSLRLRIEWFQRNLGDQGEADLVGEAWFVAAREEVLSGP